MTGFYKISCRVTDFAMSTVSDNIISHRPSLTYFILKPFVLSCMSQGPGHEIIFEFNISLIVPGNLQNMNMNSLWQRVQSKSVTRQKLVTKEFIRVKSFASKQSVDTWEQRAWHNTMPLAGQGWDEEIWWDALQPSVANGQSGIISRVHELHFCRWKLSFKIYWTVVI